MPCRVAALLLLFAHLFNGLPVAAGAVLDAAVDAADGGGADLHRLDDLLVGGTIQQQLCRLQALCHIRDLLYSAQILKKGVALFPALQTEDGIKERVRRLVSSGIFFSHCFSPYYNSGGSGQSGQFCRAEYSARYYFSTSKCESQAFCVNSFQEMHCSNPHPLARQTA